MRFKVMGIVALLVGAYFAFEGVLLAQKPAADSLRAQVYPLVAIFLALVVRVLQAEKHHRDRFKLQATSTQVAPESEVREREHHALV